MFHSGGALAAGGKYVGTLVSGLPRRNELPPSLRQAVRSRTHWGPTYFAPDPGRHLIVLSPGETASASIGFVYAGSGKAAHATYLEVTPPNAYRHAVITIPDGIGKISTADLYVTAMARHTPYQGSTGYCC